MTAPRTSRRQKTIPPQNFLPLLSQNKVGQPLRPRILQAQAVIGHHRQWRLKLPHRQRGVSGQRQRIAGVT